MVTTVSPTNTLVAYNVLHKPVIVRTELIHLTIWLATLPGDTFAVKFNCSRISRRIYYCNQMSKSVQLALLTPDSVKPTNMKRINEVKNACWITSERKLWNRPFQRMVCQLHANELLLRPLRNFLDGNAIGTRKFCGSPGREALKKC